MQLLSSAHHVTSSLGNRNTIPYRAKTALHHIYHKAQSRSARCSKCQCMGMLKELYTQPLDYHAISTCGCLSAYVLVQYLNYPVCQSKAYSKAVLEPWASLCLLRAQMVKIISHCHAKTLPLDISLVLCLYACPVYSGHFASNAAGCWLKHWNFKGQQKPSHFCIGFPSPSPDRARNWGSTGASSRITINLGFSWERMYII